MDENSEEPAEQPEHPLVSGYQEWHAARCVGQTPTTLQAISEAYLAGDTELLETYDRLLSKKDGAWIKHLVRTVRKNPDLGDVASLTAQHLHSYSAMRRAIFAVIYDKTKKTTGERNWEHENSLYSFALAYPEHVNSITAVMAELKTIDLEIVNGLITERANAHTALVAGAL